MPLSWNEIRHRAIAFSKEWSNETREDAERQSFWNDFFYVFGIKRRQVATYEEPVKKLSGDWGYIDIFWPGKMIGEHKSAGKDLGKAHAQAMDYIRGLESAGRRKEIPRYIIVSDFKRIAIHDLEPEDDPDAPLFKRIPASVEFLIGDLHEHIKHFAFIAGYEQRKDSPEVQANFDAVELMCDLHDALKSGGYKDHRLKQFLVRVLFCLFADDTGIFNPDQFKLYLRNHTAEDGSDLGAQLGLLSETLNTPIEERQKNLDQDLNEFPYVNGRLFEETLGFAAFTKEMRDALLDCTEFNWARISPAVFGSLFQSVMEPKERRQLGAHYTNEPNIMKVVRSLFLDEMREEFAAILKDRSTGRRSRLEAFHDRLTTLRFLDPACGCGNFLVITYRELRRLELELLIAVHTVRGKGGSEHLQKELTLDEVNKFSRLDVDQMFGIEIEEFPARIAEVALWLTDHQMNGELSQAFGQFYKRIPLRRSPHIAVGNALQLDWTKILPPKACSFILGNPPFVGKHLRTSAQTADLAALLPKFKNVGDIDYVCGWYFKCGDYIRGTKIRAALVSTNSITQGEQVPILWPLLWERFGIKIHFAHRTFKWESEARGKAHVHVVIIGFANFETDTKLIYDYESDATKPTVTPAKNINAYLTDFKNLVIRKAQRPLFGVPQMGCGSKPSDGKNLIIQSRADYEEILRLEPGSRKYLRRFVGSEEFLNDTERWCLWFEDEDPSDLRKLPLVMERINKVRLFREKSTAVPTQKAAKYPTRFFYVAQPKTSYLAVPEVSSDSRRYIPIGFIKPEIVASNKLYIVPTGDLYLFGLLMSAMHMAWAKTVSGRLKSDFQYSATMVYNTFPVVQANGSQREAVIHAAQQILDCRNQHSTSSLADLYDPLAMPANLAKAHEALDRAVERCYRKEQFHSDRERVEFLFGLYEKLTEPLVLEESKRIKRRNVETK